VPFIFNSKNNYEFLNLLIILRDAYSYNCVLYIVKSCDAQILYS